MPSIYGISHMLKCSHFLIVMFYFEKVITIKSYTLSTYKCIHSTPRSGKNVFTKKVEITKGTEHSLHCNNFSKSLSLSDAEVEHANGEGGPENQTHFYLKFENKNRILLKIKNY